MIFKATVLNGGFILISMAIQKIAIEDFLSLSKEYPVFDVRSPAEFLHAHIPGAYSLPLFDDEQRKIIGTQYKQQSRQQAIKTGLEYFGTKMRSMVENVEKIIDQHHSPHSDKQLQHTTSGVPGTGSAQAAPGKIILVHCWRGGMRSGAVAWLLDLYGYKVYSLSGGYKAFRKWGLQQFNKTPDFKILGGYTGSGKTVLIDELKRLGHPVINLENLANHKGSAFGDLGEDRQPSQEMFENSLALELSSFTIPGRDGLDGAWIEDESQRIGLLSIPNSIWQKMRGSPLYFLEIPFEERLNNLFGTYGQFDKEKLAERIIRIRKKLGGLETKNALNLLAKNNIAECFAILLTYYDKCYIKGLYNRKNLDSLLNKIPCRTVNISNINSLPLLQNTF